MPNKKTDRGTITTKDGNRKQVRTENRNKAVALLAGGMTQKDVAITLCTSKQQVWKWLQEPAFKTKVAESRDMIAMDAINGAAGLVTDATKTLAIALAEHDNPKLALELLDKMGVLRTTADRIGMDAAKSDGSSTPVITINISGAGIETESAIIDAESTVIDSDILDNDQ